MTAPLRRFSHSLVSTYLDCPRKAAYRYIENIPSPKSAALIKGSACDEAWNYALQVKMEDGAVIDAPALLNITEQAFRDDVHKQGGVSEVDWGDSNARESLDSALALSKAWRRDLYPAIEPTAVQVELRRTLPSGREFIGFLDFEGTVDGTPGAIGDNKTGKSRLNQAAADRGLQPSAYAWLADRPDATPFVYARAIDTGRSQYSELVWTDRTVEDNAWYGQLVIEVERAFVAEIFPPNPSSNLCGAKYCPYFERCMPNKSVHLVNATAINAESEN